MHHRLKYLIKLLISNISIDVTKTFLTQIDQTMHS